MSDGYLKFTGNYTDLHKMGFVFQKLYAANYMQWYKDGIRIFKSGNIIVHYNLNLYKLITFLQTNPVIKINTPTVSFFKFYTDASNYEYHPFTEKSQEKYNDYLIENRIALDRKQELPPIYSHELISLGTLSQLQELKNLNWYELVKY